MLKFFVQKLLIFNLKGKNILKRFGVFFLVFIFIFFNFWAIFGSYYLIFGHLNFLSDWDIKFKDSSEHDYLTLTKSLTLSSRRIKKLRNALILIQAPGKIKSLLFIAVENCAAFKNITNLIISSNILKIVLREIKNNISHFFEDKRNRPITSRCPWNL